MGGVEARGGEWRQETSLGESQWYLGVTGKFKRRGQVWVGIWRKAGS